MLGQQFGTILARTDPFDVAQALERYIRSLPGDRVRDLILNSRERMNDWYRAEFLPLVEEHDDQRLKSAFAQALKSNLRAIPVFGPAFCEGVISQVPSDRAIAVGEEIHPLRPMRPALLAFLALALVVAGAAGEHAITVARTRALTPPGVVTPLPSPLQNTAPIAAGAVAVSQTPRQVRRQAKPQPPAPSPRRQATAPTRVAVQPAPAVAQPAPAVAQPTARAVMPETPQANASAPRTASRPSSQRPSTPPPGAGVKTIVVQPVRATPSPEPSDIDVSDMPQAYTDATPLPRAQTAPPVRVAAPVALKTPTPAPNRYWLRSTIHGTLKTIGNFNPFKHHGGSAPSPSPSPSGPEQR